MPQLLWLLFLGKKLCTFSLSMQWERMKQAFERNKSPDGSGEYPSSSCSVFSWGWFSFHFVIWKQNRVAWEKNAATWMRLCRSSFAFKWMFSIGYASVFCPIFSSLPMIVVIFPTQAFVFWYFPLSLILSWVDSVLLIVEGFTCGIKMQLWFDYEESFQRAQTLQACLPTSNPSVGGTTESQLDHKNCDFIKREIHWWIHSDWLTMKWALVEGSLSLGQWGRWVMHLKAYLLHECFLLLLSGKHRWAVLFYYMLLPQNAYYKQKHIKSWANLRLSF